ncbi:hypothetical protein R3P38DRAFT_2812070 [Favolaschia claudopus]|uniref:Uncharacterized protein n=1 Tax=Favolaschia claudopus TaxID=2862362 RepID=A0AAV9Z7S8_9AGAR
MVQRSITGIEQRLPRDLEVLEGKEVRTDQSSTRRARGRHKEVAEAIAEAIVKPPPDPKITSVSLEITSVCRDFAQRSDHTYSGHKYAKNASKWTGEAAGTVGEGGEIPKCKGSSFEQMEAVRVERSRACLGGGKKRGRTKGGLKGRDGGQTEADGGWQETRDAFPFGNLSIRS